MVMSREDVKLEHDRNLSIIKTYCELEEFPSENFQRMKLSAAILRSSNDIFKNMLIYKKLFISKTNKIMMYTVKQVVSKSLRLFIDIEPDVQLMFSYQFSGYMIRLLLHFIIHSNFFTLFLTWSLFFI